MTSKVLQTMSQGYGSVFPFDPKPFRHEPKWRQLPTEPFSSRQECLDWGLQRIYSKGLMKSAFQCGRKTIRRDRCIPFQEVWWQSHLPSVSIG